MGMVMEKACMTVMIVMTIINRVVPFSIDGDVVYGGPEVNIGKFVDGIDVGVEKTKMPTRK